MRVGAGNDPEWVIDAYSLVFAALLLPDCRRPSCRRPVRSPPGALNVILAAAAIAGTVRAVPESAAGHAPRLDVVGAIIAAFGMLALVFSVVEAPDYGWASTPR